MAAKRIPALDVLTGAQSATDDKIVIFDATADTTKAITRVELGKGIVGDLPYTPSGGIAATTIPAAIAELNTEAAKSATLAAAGGAALIGNTPAGTIAATTVQGAVNEIVSDLAATGGAATIGIADVGGYFTGTTVEAALQEVGSVANPTKVTSKRFEGIATDDAGTPDAVFRVDRTHVAATSPHSFRDQTVFSPTTAGLAAASFDSAIVSGGSANLDHTIGFQARPVHSGSGTLTDLQGYGWYPTVSGPVTNTWGVEIRTPSGGGTVTNEYGIRIKNLTKGTNKYPIFIDNNLGTNVIGAATNFNNSGVVSVGGAVKIFMGDPGNGYKSIAYNHNMNSNTYDYGTNIQSMYFGPQDITFRCADVGVAGATPSFVDILNIRTDSGNPSYRAVFPAVNDVSNLGVSGFRWKEIFCTNGTINTSDARVKTEVRLLTDNEIAASKNLAREIGSFKFLAAVAEKGDKARDHIGMTVQRAIEIMQSHGLDPMAYGFICYDEWGDEFEDHPAIYHQVLNEDGEIVNGEIKDPAWREHKMKAGDLYSFRTEQLLLFIARGFEARLSALEEK